MFLATLQIARQSSNRLALMRILVLHHMHVRSNVGLGDADFGIQRSYDEQL